MYSPYPPYGYMPGPYDTSQYASAPYESYYAEQPQQMPLTSVPPPRPPPPAPLQQRLSIRDPTTGSVVPVVTPEQIEQAVSSHHKKRPVWQTSYQEKLHACIPVCSCPVS